MPASRRPREPGAAGFLRVAPADRSSRLLVERVEALREAGRATRAKRPFGVEAWVVLPDHMRCVWRLPEGTATIRCGGGRSRRGSRGW